MEPKEKRERVNKVPCFRHHCGKRQQEREMAERRATAVRDLLSNWSERVSDERTLRRQLEEEAEIRRKMRMSCRGYNPMPIQKMTNEEARKFSVRQTMGSIESLGMSSDEAQQYASAIYESILYFNNRDAEHAEYMRYLDECREANDERKRREEEERQKRRKEEIFVQII